MTSRQAVQSRGGRGTGTQQTRNVQQQTLLAYLVDSALWKYVTKIGPKEKTKVVAAACGTGTDAKLILQGHT